MAEQAKPPISLIRHGLLRKLNSDEKDALIRELADYAFALERRLTTENPRTEGEGS